MPPPNSPWGRYQQTMIITPCSPHPSRSWHSLTPCRHYSRTQDHHRDKPVNKSHNCSQGQHWILLAWQQTCHCPSIYLNCHFTSCLVRQTRSVHLLVKVQPGRETTFFISLNLAVAAQDSSFTQQGSLATILPLPVTWGCWVSSGHENTPNWNWAAEYEFRTCQLQAQVQLSRSHPKTLCQASATQLLRF